MAESAPDAAMRAARPLMDQIRSEALREQDRLVAERVRARDEDGRRRDDRKTALELVPGEFARVAGEWMRVELVTDAGDLVLVNGGNRMFYKVTDGERFVWHGGAF